MFEQTFKNIDDILHKDAGCGSELDYVEQTSWILFLKYLDDFEKDKKAAAKLAGKTYTDIIKPEYRWQAWAVPKGKECYFLTKACQHKGWSKLLLYYFSYFNLPLKRAEATLRSRGRPTLIASISTSNS